MALRYIAGGISAANVDSEWVLTSYLAANATILPISGWLSARLGRRNYFLLSIALFTIASGLCGMATSLWQIILFRVQGLAGGGLQPSSQGALLDAFPPEKQGVAQTMFGVAALLGPVVGPTLGGYLTVQYNWRWIFYINVPVGILALVMCYFVVDDPDYLQKECAELHRQPLNFDYIGLGLLALVMSCWEIMLSKGQEWDWLGDPFCGIQTLSTLFVLGLGCLIFREMRIDNPIVNFRVLGERNLAAASIIIFCAYAVLYACGTSLPGLLQSVFGYDAYVSGLVQSPAGVFAVLGMLVVVFVIDRGADARWLVAGGLLVMAAGCYWMALDEHLHQPRHSDLAAHRDDLRPVDDLRSAQRGGLQIHAASPARGGGRPVCPAPKRGRKCWHIDVPDHRGAPPAIPRPARGEFLDPLNPHVNTFMEQARPPPGSRRGTRPRRNRWPCRRSRASANSRRCRWPGSTSSGSVLSWAWASCSWWC